MAKQADGVKMPASQVLIGDICKLASGGPLMTVTEVIDTPNELIECMYFDHTDGGMLWKNRFPLKAVRFFER